MSALRKSGGDGQTTTCPAEPVPDPPAPSQRPIRTTALPFVHAAAEPSDSRLQGNRRAGG